MSHQGPAGPPWGQPAWSRRPEPAGTDPYPPTQPYQRPPEEPPAYPGRPYDYQPDDGSGYGHGYRQDRDQGYGRGQDPGRGPDQGGGYGPDQPPGYGQPDPYPSEAPGYQPPGPYQRPEPGVNPYREPQDQQVAQPRGYDDSRAGYQGDAGPDAPTTQFTRPADLGPPADAAESKKDGRSGSKPKRRSAKKRPRTGKLVAFAAGAVVLVLALVSGGVWYLTGDADQQSTSRAAPVSGDKPPEDVKAAVGLRLASSRTAEVLFPPTLRPVDKPEHTREAVGEADCPSIAASKAARAALTKAGCKKVYLALYVDEAKKYAVTFGYIDVGSAAKAKKGADRNYGDYPKYNTWFKFLIPEGSKVTTKTRIFTYVSPVEKYVTFGTCAYYDGRNAKKELDEPLTREAIAVGVALMFS